MSDFTPGTPIFAVPCETPPEGDGIDAPRTDCDIAEVAATVTDGQGAATFVVTWEIPEEGITVYVGDQSRDNEVTVEVSPSTGDGEQSDVAVLGTSVAQTDEPEELADTGPREVVLVTLIGTALVGIGLTFRGIEHRRTA